MTAFAAGLFRWVLALLGACALSGCFFDGFRLPDTWSWQAWKPVALLPDRSTFLTRVGDQGVYSRFVQVDGGRYAWEAYTEDDGETKLQVLDSAFLPLGSGWHLLHWRNLQGSQQGAHLVRLDGAALVVAEVSKIDPAVLRRMAATAGVQLGDASMGFGKPVTAPDADRFMRFVGMLPASGPPVVRHERVGGVPARLLAAGLQGAVPHVNMIDASEVADPTQARRVLSYFRALHEEGHGLGSYGYARCANNGWGMAVDTRLSRALALAAVSRGVAHANTLLGYIAYFGLQQPVDHRAAVAYFRRAAEVRDGRAYHGLGLAHLEGQGVEKNLPQAAVWFEQAAKQGLPLSRTALAEMLILGTGVARDDARAVQLLDEAVAAEAPTAYQWRAWMHASGRGGPKDEVAASRLYLRAAQAGLPLSQWQIGERLVAGQGVPADRDAGLQWLEKAAASGQAQAAARLAVLKAAPPMSSPASSAEAEKPLWARAAASAAQASIEGLERQGAQLHQEIGELSKRQRGNMLRMREIMGPQLELMNDYTRLAALLHEQIGTIDALLRHDLEATQRAQLASERRQHAGKLDDVLRKRARMAGREPEVLSWRLPSGRLVLPRPDGAFVALAPNSKLPRDGIDTATLPRSGDRLLEGADLGAMVSYVDSWSGAPTERPGIAAVVKRLNELMNGFHCDIKGPGAVQYAVRPAKVLGPVFAVDANHVVRYHHALGDTTGQVWHERISYMPLAKADTIEMSRWGRSATCAAALIRCQGGSYCEESTAEGPDVDTSAGLKLYFPNEAAMNEAVRALNQLLQQARTR